MTHVVVAGAGIGGLSAALALADAGITVTVLERRDALAEYGAGLQLSPNATRVLHRLDLLAQVQACAIQPQNVRVRRGRDGADLIRFPLGAHARDRFEAPFLLVLRSALQRVLFDRIEKRPGVEVRFGTAVDRADVNGSSGVSVWTDQGQLAADGFVDARGVGSRRDAFHAGRVAWRALVPAERLAAGALEPESNLWLGTRAHLVHYPLPDRAHVNVVAITEDKAADGGTLSDLWSRPADIDVLRASFGGWCAEAMRLLDRAAEWRRWPLLAAPPLRRWSTGPATVLGDAAHPMMPFLAQGASQAIEDAGILAECLRGNAAVANAFAAYETRRVGRATRVQQASRKQGTIYHLPRPASDARDLTLAILGGQRSLERLAWLYDA